MRLIDKYLPSDYSDNGSKRINPTEPLGLQVGIGFQNLISERSYEGIILRKNDKHLCFWVCIYCSLPDGAWQEVSVTIVVKFINFLGRIYFIGIWVLHKLLVKGLFRKAIKSK